MKKMIMICALFGCASTCFGKAYYAPKEEMIEKADCIAVVNITEVRDQEKEGRTRTYRQQATGTIEQCLKGGVSGEITIYGMGTFICAQCRYETGRFLLFLRKEGDGWTGSNWHLGIRPISETAVQWFKEGASRFEVADAALDDVLEEIRSVLAKQAAASTAMAFLAQYEHKDRYECDKPIRILDAPEHWNVFFKRRNFSGKPNSGLIRVDKKTGEAAWVPQR